MAASSLDDPVDVDQLLQPHLPGGDQQESPRRARTGKAAPARRVSTCKETQIAALHLSVLFAIISSPTDTMMLGA
jgi:hypothetical protein